MAEPTASNYPASLDSDVTLGGDQVNFAQVTLDVGIDGAEQTISVAEDISGINTPCYLLFDSELIYAPSNAGGNFTSCVRGAGGTVADIHTINTVGGVVYAANFFNQLKRAIVAIETELGAAPSSTSTDLVTRLSRILNGTGHLNFTASSELTIATGSITPTQNWHTVDTESDAASDDLDTIAVTNVADGFFLAIRANNTARTVVVKNGTGNILTSDAKDITLDETYKAVYLIYDATLTKWVAVQGTYTNPTHRIRGTVANPNSYYTNIRAQIPMFRADAALTITRIHIHGADLTPTSEMAGDLKFADDINTGGFANATVIDVCDTTSGVFTATSSFDDATVPSGKYVYFQMDAAPHADWKDFYIEVYYTYD